MNQAKKIGIQSLFGSIRFEIDIMVCDRLNIAVTYYQAIYFDRQWFRFNLGKMTQQIINILTKITKILC